MCILGHFTAKVKKSLSGFKKRLRFLRRKAAPENPKRLFLKSDSQLFLQQDQIAPCLELKGGGSIASMVDYQLIIANHFQISLGILFQILPHRIS